MTDYTKLTEDNLSRQIHPVLYNTAKDGSGTWYFPIVDTDGKVLAVMQAGTNVIGKVRLVTADGDEITDDTANAIKALLLTAAGVDAIGEVQASPTANTILGRLDEIEAAIDEFIVLVGEVQASPTENTLLERQKAIETALTAINTLIGEVQVSPTENTVLDRLKDLLTGIVLATGSNAIGKLAANSGVDIGDVDILSIAAGTNVIGKVRLVTAAGDEITDDTHDDIKTHRGKGGLISSGVKSADTLIYTGACTIDWISFSDSAILNLELNDSTDNGGTDVWAFRIPADGYGHIIFDKPIPCATGIYLDVSTATCLVVVGYTPD